MYRDGDLFTVVHLLCNITRRKTGKGQLYSVEQFLIFKNPFPLLSAWCLIQYKHSKPHFISKRVEPPFRDDFYSDVFTSDRIMATSITLLWL